MLCLEVSAPATALWKRLLSPMSVVAITAAIRSSFFTIAEVAERLARLDPYGPQVDQGRRSHRDTDLAVSSASPKAIYRRF